VHVFHFTEKPEYIAIAERGGSRIFANPRFAHWLIDHNHLAEVPEDEATEGDLVFYFADSGLKHAGLLRDDGRVTSKWGIGHLYEHELFEVPESYGTYVRFFKPVPYDVAYDHLTHFAEENGMRFRRTDP